MTDERSTGIAWPFRRGPVPASRRDGESGGGAASTEASGPTTTAAALGQGGPPAPPSSPPADPPPGVTPATPGIGGPGAPSTSPADLEGCSASGPGCDDPEVRALAAQRDRLRGDLERVRSSLPELALAVRNAKDLHREAQIARAMAPSPDADALVAERRALLAAAAEVEARAAAEGDVLSAAHERARAALETASRAVESAEAAAVRALLAGRLDAARAQVLAGIAVLALDLRDRGLLGGTLQAMLAVQLGTSAVGGEGIHRATQELHARLVQEVRANRAKETTT